MLQLFLRRPCHWPGAARAYRYRPASAKLRHAAGMPKPPSVPGIRIHQAAVAIEVVEPARQAQPLRAERRLVDLAVIAYGLHDLVGEVVLEAEPLAELAFEAEEFLQLRIARRFLHVVDIGLGDAELLRFQHREMRPLHDVGPAVVALSCMRAERLPRQYLGEEDPIV